MQRTEASKRTIMFATSSIIWLVMVMLWYANWMIFYDEEMGRPFWNKGNWLLAGVYGAILFFITYLYGGYRVGDYRRGDIIFSAGFSMIVTNVITYFQISLIAIKLVRVMPMLLLSGVEFLVIWVWATWAGRMYHRLYPPHNLLVVFGGSSLTQSLIVKMSERTDKYRIQEAINIDEGFAQVFDRIQSYDSVLICDVPSGQRNKVLKYCYERSVRVYMTPKISDILIRGAGNIHLFDTPLLISRNTGPSVEQLVLKRVMDVVLSAIALVAASPIMGIVALAIKLHDHGPVLYKQHRMTKGGKVFLLYKFRSMIVDAEKELGAILAGENDDRITPVGRIIRKYRLDELPQLINIFKGDMSIVGPRPERPELIEQYCLEMEEFSFRLKVKAGLTGYAQVLGKYNTTPYDKLKLDLMYIAGYSVLLDIKLILQTLKILFVKESTEGISASK